MRLFGSKSPKTRFLGDFPYSVIQNPYLMAEFHKHRPLGRSHWPNFPIFGILTLCGILHRKIIVKKSAPPPLDFLGHQHVWREALFRGRKCDYCYYNFRLYLPKPWAQFWTEKFSHKLKRVEKYEKRKYGKYPSSRA